MDGDRPRRHAMLEHLSNEASASDLVCVGGPIDRLFHERAGVTHFDAPGYATR